MKVLVCGGRDYADKSRVFDVLDAEHARSPISLIIHGAARGADSLAKEWAEARDVPHKPYPITKADWKAGLRAAGPIRNQKMLVEGSPQLVVAFPGGNGTADMVRRSLKAGVVVRRI